MPFGIGGSSSRSSSSSSSLDYGANASTSFSDSLGTSVSTARGGSSQRVANQSILDLLNASGVDAFGRASSLAPLLQGQAGQLFSGGMGFLDELQGGNAGSDYLSSRVSGQSPVLDQQIDALGGDLGRFFREELNPAITGDAVAAGQLGGGRQGVAQGRATDAVAREFQTGATNLRAQDMIARDNAAATYGAQRIGASQTGLAGLESLFGVAQGGAMADLSPVQMLASIIGGPTVLTDSYNTSDASSIDIARAMSEAFGFNYGTSESSSSSRGRTFSLSGD